jgi:large subunit ribosomal protein L24e
MECSFCGTKIPRGTETIFVTKRGKALYFCTSKCEKNLLKLERKERDVKWTNLYRQEKVIRTKYATIAPKEAIELKKDADLKEVAKDMKEVKPVKAEKKKIEAEAPKKEKKAPAKKAPAKKAGGKK